MVDAVTQVCPNDRIDAFRDAPGLLAYVEKMRACDVAFIDIELREMSGLELVKRLKTLVPAVNVIFATGYSQYAMDAFGLHASGYLLKPVAPADVERELKALRNPIVEPAPRSKLRIQTFGNFEVFYDDVPLHFYRMKTKEMFAYLVDRRGASCTMAQIAAVLWEEKEYGRSQLNQIHTFLADIKKTLGDVGMENVIIKRRNSIALNVDMVDCDYFNFLRGDRRAVNSYMNEYMSNYSWAEFTVGKLDAIVKEGK